MHHELIKVPAVAAAILIAAAVAVPLAAEDVYPECHLHRSAEVSFRAPGSHDVLEISIGTGICYKATLTLVIRDAEGGVIFYSYVERFKLHTPVNWKEPDLNEVAKEVIDNMIKGPMESTLSLPPYAEPEEYYEKTFNYIQVNREEYELLRTEDRPMFRHLTHYEEWQYVIWDSETQSKVIITGGL